LSLLDGLAVVVLALPVVDWVAVWALHRFVGHYPYLAAARERRRVAVAIAVLTSLFAVLAMARLGHLQLPNELLATLLVLAVILLSAVNLAFLVQYRGALFGNPPPPEED
jgi:hypothetical protein